MDFNDFLVIFRGIEHTKTGICMGNTIWLSNIAMDNDPFIDAKNDDLPIKEWWFSSSQPFSVPGGKIQLCRFDNIFPNMSWLDSKDPRSVVFFVVQIVGGESNRDGSH